MVAGADNRVRDASAPPGRQGHPRRADQRPAPAPTRRPRRGPAERRGSGRPPPNGTFLGVPIAIHGHVWGNLYLTEKAAGEFTPIDEQAAVILAEWAAVAIENARLFDVGETGAGSSNVPYGRCAQ